MTVKPVRSADYSWPILAALINFALIQWLGDRVSPIISLLVYCAPIVAAVNLYHHGEDPENRRLVDLVTVACLLFTIFAPIVILANAMPVGLRDLGGLLGFLIPVTSLSFLAWTNSWGARRRLD